MKPLWTARLTWPWRWSHNSLGSWGKRRGAPAQPTHLSRFWTRSQRNRNMSSSSSVFGFHFIRGQKLVTIKYPLSVYCSNRLISVSVFPLLYLRVHFYKQEFFSNETYFQQLWCHSLYLYSVLKKRELCSDASYLGSCVPPGQKPNLHRLFFALHGHWASVFQMELWIWIFWCHKTSKRQGTGNRKRGMEYGCMEKGTCTKGINQDSEYLKVTQGFSSNNYLWNS